MSSEAVVEFVNRSEADPGLKERLAEARGAGEVVRLAAGHGFSFTVEELEPVVSLLGFLQEVTRDVELQDALGYAPDAQAVVDLAARRGYRFSVADLGRISLTEASELNEEDLQAVTGGAGSGVRPQSGLRVQLSSSTRRETPQTDFSTVFKSGVSKSGNTTLSGASIAAPYVPGGAVVSAAISGVSQVKSSGSG